MPLFLQGRTQAWTGRTVDGKEGPAQALGKDSFKQYGEDQPRLWWTACWSVVRQAALRCSLVFQVALSELCLAIYSCPHLCLELPQAAARHTLLLGSFIICASKACKCFMDSVQPRCQGTSLGPCPVLWESAIESAQGLRGHLPNATFHTKT